MERYIAYFDFLGYKEFILNNDSQYLKRRVSNILRDIETSLSDDLTLSESGTVIADLEQARVHCLNISDTVIFYSNDNSPEHFEVLLEVAFKFNNKCNLYHFPVRGVITLEEFDIISNVYTNGQGLSYRPNIMYGRGLVETHLKCDFQEWAGCCIDNKVIESVLENKQTGKLYQLAIKYPVPLKTSKYGAFSDHAVRLYLNGGNDGLVAEYTQRIDRIFEMDNKDMTHASIPVKIDNTKKFINYLKDK